MSKNGEDEVADRGSLELMQPSCVSLAEFLDGGGDEDEGDEEVAQGEEEEGPVRLLAEAGAPHEGEQEAQVQHEARHEGQPQEGGVSPTVEPANINFYSVFVLCLFYKLYKDYFSLLCANMCEYVHYCVTKISPQCAYIYYVF